MSFRLGQFELDTSTRELRDRETGALVHLEPKAFGLLAVLVENAGRVVSRDEIFEAVWEGRILSDTVISSAVRDLRRALGDDGRRQAMIRTAHGLGFRYVGPLEQSGSLAPGDDGETRPLTICVRSFARLDGNTGDGFQEAVHQGILTELGRFRATIDLTVADTGPIDFDLAGSVWVIGETLRINVQLTDRLLSTGIWAERYDCPIGPGVEKLDETFRSIAATVYGRMMALGQRRAMTEDSTRALILRARALYDQISKTAYTRELPLLEAMVAEEPDHLMGNVLISGIQDMAVWTGWSDDLARSKEQAVLHGRRAVAIDPADSTARTRLAEALWHAGEHAQAALHFARSVDLNPNDVTARSLHATFLVCINRAEEALAELDICRHLDPYELNWIPWLRADAYFALGRFDETIAALQEVIHPINNARSILVASYAHLGQIKAAEDALETFLSVARDEMAEMPRDWDGWKAFFDREGSGGADHSQLDLLMSGLDAAGLRKRLDAMRE